MAKEAWGRWGKNDEAGATNFIGPEVMRSAASLVREGRSISLSQPLSPETPIPAHRPGMMHLMNRDGGDYAAGGRRPGGFQFAEDTVVLPLHIGTHIDALCHVWYDDSLYNGFSSNTIRSTTRAARCGVEKMRPIVTRGVLLDFVSLRGTAMRPDETIGLSAVRAALRAANTTLQKGDAVLLRTGWQEQHAGEKHPPYDVEPGLDVEAGRWLAESDVSLVGADNFAIEVLPFPAGEVFPVHQCLIRDYGIPLLENLVLRELADTGKQQFLFVASPLPITGATGSPVNPLAIF